MLIALTSVKHAPGVTTTALGLASAWPRPVLLAECDPAGTDIPAWLQLPTGPGLVDAALELRRVKPQQASDVSPLWGCLTGLSGERLWLLRGVEDPGQSGAIAGSWPLLAGQLAGLRGEDGPIDVVADCGRLSDAHTPWPVLEAADIVGLTVAPTVAGVRLAGRWLPSMQQRLAGDGSCGPRLRLLVVGAGPYPPAEIAGALEMPLMGSLPDDRQAAEALAAGGGRGLGRSRLWRALTQLANDLSLQRPLSVDELADGADAPSTADAAVAAAVVA